MDEDDGSSSRSDGGRESVEVDRPRVVVVGVGVVVERVFAEGNVVEPGDVLLNPPYLQKSKSPASIAFSSAPQADCNCSRLAALPGHSS